MSTIPATVDDAVVAPSTSRGTDSPRAATVIAVIAAAQVTWFAALAYGLISLLT